MAVIEWVRFLAGAFLLLFGLVIFAIEMVGVFRFRYVLNRMHAAAMGDTLGIGFSLAGLIVMNGFNFTSMKLFLVIVFLWFASPVSSHLIARLEVTTDEEPQKHYSSMTIKEAHAHFASQERTQRTKQGADAVCGAGKERKADAGEAAQDGKTGAGEETQDRKKRAGSVCEAGQGNQSDGNVYVPHTEADKKEEM